MYSPVQSSRLYEQIVQQIEARILSGELQHGDQLPSERDLAGQFNVSRTAVREAVKALRGKGLIEVHPGRGTFVTDGAGEALRHSLDMAVKITEIAGSGSLVEVREIFEPEIAALAALRATQADIDAMAGAVAAMDTALEDADAFIEADLDFHLALAEGTGNAIFPMLIDPMVDLLREQRGRIFQVPGGASRGQVHHKRILEAITRRDPEAARAAMRDHLRQVREDGEAAKEGSSTKGV